MAALILFKSQCLLLFVKNCWLLRNATTYTWTGNAEGGSIPLLLTSRLTGLGQSVLQTKTKNLSCHTADSKPVKQEVNIQSPPLVFPDQGLVMPSSRFQSPIILICDSIENTMFKNITYINKLLFINQYLFVYLRKAWALKVH